MRGSRQTNARALKNARPTSGKVFQALFNILGSSGRLDGSGFLDLFSGTGDVAMEALSRGAAPVAAVESDRALADRITSRMRGQEGGARCICGDVRRVVPRLARECAVSGGYGVVFADPPYCMGWGEVLPGLIEGNPSLLSASGVFVLERSIRETPAEISIPRDDRIYGETVLSFYWPGEGKGG
jgi:16S rRNA (guanine(966)-N(2))-methyltransferase RsmD